MNASRRTPASFVAVAMAIGASLLATACGGGGSGQFSNTSLVELSTTSVPAGATGQPYAAQFTAKFPHPPGQFVVSAGQLPPGVQLNPLTGEVTGFPRQLGRFNFDISARDGLDPTLPLNRDVTFSEAVRSFAVDVSRGTPNILPQVIPAAQYRHSFLYKLDVAGGTPPYAFAMTGGTLPNGITLAQDGTLGNFPTQPNVAQGVPFEFDAQVTDANNLTDTAHFTLGVTVLPLIILTSNLNEAAKDFPYDTELKLASNGGGQPITWSQLAPTGSEVSLASIGMEITSDGHLRNSIAFPGPTSTGNKLFTLKVTDEAGQITTRQFTLKVNPGPVITSISPARAALPGPYTVTGANFQPGAVLVFKPGLTEVTITPVFVSGSQLRFNNAPSAPGGGAVPVKVVNPDTGAYTKAGAFVFTASSVAFGSKGFLSSSLSSTGLDCADVNGDGFADVVHSGASGIYTYSGSPSSTSPGLIYHRNLGTTPPTFSSQTLDGGSFYDCKFSDVNTDGKIDIVALGSAQVKVFLNGTGGNPLGTFASAIASGFSSGSSYPSEMTIGKFNSDGLLDIAFGVPYQGGAGSTGKVFTMVGNGSGSFSLVGQATTTMNNVGGTYGVPTICSGDSDGDGRDEICAGVGFNAGYYPGCASNYNALNSDGSFVATWSTRANVTTPNYYFTTTGAASGDFLGTGTPALLTVTAGLYSYYAGQALFMYTGANYTTATPLTGPTAISKSIGTVDADFDTKLDWVISSKPSIIDVYRGSSKTSVVTLDASTGSPGVSSPVTGRIAGGDIDGDGRPDILVTTSSWICEGMGSVYGSYYAQGISGDGGSKGFVWYLNASN